MTDLLDQIEAECAAASVPLADVLRRAGVAQSSYSRWKNGHFEPRNKTMRRMREALAALKQDAAPRLVRDRSAKISAQGGVR